MEDPGIPPASLADPDYLATIWRYTIETDTLERVARHDPLGSIRISLRRRTF
jgi:hypothetical protein